MENTPLVNWMSRVMRQFLWAMHYIPKHIEFSISHHRLLKSSCMLFFYEINTTPKKVVDGDDASIENTKEKELRNTNIEESKDEPLLEALQRKENQHEDLPKT